MELDLNIIDKIQKQENQRADIKLKKKQQFIDNFTAWLPSEVGNFIKMNPNIDLLYIASQLGLKQLYKNTLDIIGYSIEDYMFLVLLYYKNCDNFDLDYENKWVIEDNLCINKRNSTSITIESNLGDITIYKNYLTSNLNRYNLLEPYEEMLDIFANKNECHLLTYANTKISNCIASTGFINDLYGPMIHSWCEEDDKCIDLAFGYITDRKSFELINKVGKVNRISSSDIISHNIPHSYQDNKLLVRSLPYLMYKQNK